jgi:hypothetical protein
MKPASRAEFRKGRLVEFPQWRLVNPMEPRGDGANELNLETALPLKSVEQQLDGFLSESVALLLFGAERQGKGELVLQLGEAPLLGET